MTWTTDTPQEDGHYWVRFAETQSNYAYTQLVRWSYDRHYHAWRLTELDHNSDELWVHDDRRIANSPEFDRITHWQGPLDVPSDPEAGGA